jgi:hypothetical protein
MAKVYIAGPMTGLPDYNRPAFFTAETVLQEYGHTVLNPAVLPDGLEYCEYMRISKAMLMCADSIYLLEGWENSKGAITEKMLVMALNLAIEYQAGN